MTELVPLRKGKPIIKVSLDDIQDRLDARQPEEVVEAPLVVSSKKSRVAAAKRSLQADPLATVVRIQNRAADLSSAFDQRITLDQVPLSREQIERLSAEYLEFERLKVEIEALDTRYRELIFAHLDETVDRIPGRPISQTPGRVEADIRGPHHIFERRGGNRANPTLNTDTLRAALPAEVADQIYVTIHHKAVEAYDEEVFDEARFAELVDNGTIDLDIVAEHLLPGEWRTPTFYRTLVDGD